VPPRTRARNATANGGRRRDQEVLAAAVKVFHERSYSAATVQDVADELGILKGSLYHYIDSKEDLLFRLSEAVHADLDQIRDEVKQTQGLSALQRLELYVRRQLEYSLENLAAITVYHHDADRLEGERLDTVTSARRTGITFVSGLIKEAQEAGDADTAVEARLLANCVSSSVIGATRWYRPGRDSRQKIVDACATYALNGVRPAAAPKPAKPKRRKAAA
jgi:TetR/AcrR family transcriptional regulator, cholesterol catabolism regulator